MLVLSKMEPQSDRSFASLDSQPTISYCNLFATTHCKRNEDWLLRIRSQYDSRFFHISMNGY